MIVIPSSKYVEGELPEYRIGLEGWFTLQAIKRGRVVRSREFKQGKKECGPFHNLITDLGLDRIGSQAANAVYRYCVVGTGTATPTAADTQLAAYHGLITTASGSNSTGPSPDYYTAIQIIWTSGIGDLGTVNLTEVGVGGTNGNSLLFSRELIRDPGGSPVAFPLLNDEQLRVIYQLRMYPPLTDNPATVLIGASSHDTITRALNVNSTTNAWGFMPISGAASSWANFQTNGADASAYSGDLAAITATSPAGTNLGFASLGAAGYSNGNHYRDLSATWGPTVGNGNIRTVLLRNNATKWQVRYDPVIAKTNTQQLVLNQRVSWARR